MGNEIKEPIEALEIYRKNEIEPISKPIEALKNAKNFEKVYSVLPSLSSIIEGIKTNVNDENEVEMAQLSTTINKAIDNVSTLRKEWYAVKTEKLNVFTNGMEEFENLLNLKREEINKNGKKNNQKNIDLRYKLFEQCFEEQKKGFDIFEWITFEEHFKDSKMGNKGNVNIQEKTKEETLKKGAKENFIINKLNQFDDDKLALGNDLIAIENYKNNGFNVAKAIAFSKEQEELREQTEKAKIKAETEKKERQESLFKTTSRGTKIEVTKTTKEVKEVKPYETFVIQVPAEKVVAFEESIKRFGFEYKKGE